MEDARGGARVPSPPVATLQPVPMLQVPKRKSSGTSGGSDGTRLKRHAASGVAGARRLCQRSVPFSTKLRYGQPVRAVMDLRPPRVCFSSS